MYSCVNVHIRLLRPCSHLGCGNKEGDSHGVSTFLQAKPPFIPVVTAESVDCGSFNSTNGPWVQEPDLMAQRPAWHRQSVSTFLWLRSPVGQIITGSLVRRGCSVCLWLCLRRQGTTCGALRTRPQTRAFSLPLASHGLSSGSSPRCSSSRLHLPSPLSHPPCRRLENTSTTHGSERQ